jgi:hypothetical protein
VMHSGRSFAVNALLVLSVMALSLAAQEEAPPAVAGRGRGGGRGGRGGTREFLGLGPAPDDAAAKKGESRKSTVR